MLQLSSMQMVPPASYHVKDVTFASGPQMDSNLPLLFLHRPTAPKLVIVIYFSYVSQIILLFYVLKITKDELKLLDF